MNQIKTLFWLTSKCSQTKTFDLLLPPIFTHALWARNSFQLNAMYRETRRAVQLSQNTSHHITSSSATAAVLKGTCIWWEIVMDVVTLLYRKLIAVPEIESPTGCSVAVTSICSEKMHFGIFGTESAAVGAKTSKFNFNSSYFLIRCIPLSKDFNLFAIHLIQSAISFWRKSHFLY